MTSSENMIKLASMLVNYSCSVKPKEKVLIEARDIPNDFLEILIEEVWKAGAYPFVWELEPNAADILSLFTGLYTLAAFGPSIGVQIRRLHDAGFSGWWWWLFFFPFFGWLFLLILYTLPSTPTPNR